MIKFILSISVVVILGIYSIPNAIVCFFISDKEKVRKYNHWLIGNILSFVLWIDNVKPVVEGKENLQSINNEKSIFIISNHRGYFDILTGYVTIGRICGIVAKDSLNKIPVLNLWMKKIDCIFLDRKNLRSGMEMVLKAIKLIEEGVSIWIFPEGTRNKSDMPHDLMEFKNGLFKIPEKTNCYILPMAILDAEYVFEKQLPRIKSRNVHIKIGQPYKISELSEENRQNIGEYSQNIMKELLIDLENKYN